MYVASKISGSKRVGGDMIGLLKILVLIILISALPVQAKLVNINALGSSPKGQYVAIEESGYKLGSKLPFTRIRVMNMWKNKYVTKPVIVIGKEKDISLTSIRKRAFEKAVVQFKKYNINH